MSSAPAPQRHSMRRYISPRSTATHCRGYLDPLRLLRHVTPSHAYISGRQVITAPIILSHIPPSSINNGVRGLIIVRDIRPTEREALPPRIIFSCIGGAFAFGFARVDSNAQRQFIRHYSMPRQCRNHNLRDHFWSNRVHLCWSVCAYRNTIQPAYVIPAIFDTLIAACVCVTACICCE